jgi:preprotein translocase subunit YajC
MRLLSLHNLRFLVRLAEQAREAIMEGRLESWADDWLRGSAPGRKTRRRGRERDSGLTTRRDRAHIQHLAIALQAPANRGGMILIIYIVSFGLIAWFLLIRPQRRMQQQHQQMLSALKRGDEVMTDGGIIGTVVHLTDDRVTVKSGENTRIVVARGKIARILSGAATQG